MYFKIKRVAKCTTNKEDLCCGAMQLQFCMSCVADDFVWSFGVVFGQPRQKTTLAFRRLCLVFWNGLWPAQTKDHPGFQTTLSGLLGWSLARDPTAFLFRLCQSARLQNRSLAQLLVRHRTGLWHSQCSGTEPVSGTASVQAQNSLQQSQC